MHNEKLTKFLACSVALNFIGLCLVGCVPLTIFSPGNANLGADALTPAILNPSPSQLNFGTVALTRSTDQTITIQKKGTRPATFATTSIQAPFSYKGGTFPGSGGTCEPVVTADCTLVVTYAPVASTQSNSAIIFEYSDGVKSRSAFLSFQGTGLAISELSLNSSSFDFGSIRINSPSNVSSTTVVISYSGPHAVTQIELQGLSAPFSFLGGSYPGTGGTCGVTVSAGCTIVLGYTPTSIGNTLASLNLVYTNELGQQSQPLAVSGKAFEPTAADSVLVVYNAASTDSVTIKNYLMAHRPGYSSANVMSVNTADVEIVASQATYQNEILNPIVSWIQGHAEKQIHYIILLYGIPSRVSGNTSVQFQLNYSLNPARLNFYVSHIAMGTVAATASYIDKLEAVYGQMAHPALILSAQSAGRGGNSYHFDDADRIYNFARPGLDAKNAVLAVNPSASVNYQASTHIATASDVLGYQTWGYNGGQGGAYATNGSVVFTGNSSWYLIETIESYNGQRNGAGFQGNFITWFSQNAFGGINYANTPLGAVSHVEEPGLSGVSSPTYFSLWESGYLFIEAAWQSRRTEVFMAVGDPLVTK